MYIPEIDIIWSHNNILYTNAGVIHENEVCETNYQMNFVNLSQKITGFIKYSLLNTGLIPCELELFWQLEIRNCRD